MKAILATVGAVFTAVTLGAQEADENAAELEAEETPVFEAGFDLDFMSAYVDKNAVANDDLVMQPCVWADLTYFEPFWLGFSIWQNYDLTDRRATFYRYGLNETDYNVHLGATVWESEDGECSFGLELGHDWFTLHGVRDGLRDDNPDTSEVYVKATFDNPFVNVYGKAAYMYRDYGCYKQGMYYELGFNKEVALADTLTAGVDWSLGFGDSRYLGYLYGQCEYRYDDATDEEFSSNPDSGFGGTTVKLYLTWDITDWMALKGTVAYTGVLNGSARQGLADHNYYSDDNGDLVGYWGDGTRDMYPRDLFWGGLSLNIAF